MFKRLIDALTLNYEFVAKSRGVLTAEETRQLVAGGRTMVRHAPEVMVPANTQMTESDKLDLEECQVISGHIEELASWIDQLMRDEIV